MNSQQIGIISILKSALDGNKRTLPDDFDVAVAVKVAQKHQISAMFYYGALNCGISSSHPNMEQLFLQTCALISVSEQQMHSINEIFRLFDQNGIKYMPLKGTLLKKLYPKSEMRTMSDADILINTEQYDDIKPLMQSLGFSEILESDHELVWQKSNVHIELHKRLIPSYNKDYYEYFGDGWRLGKPCEEGACRYVMSAEDEMIYLFTHFAKHYRDAGIGIKHFIDLWVFRSSVKELNPEYILCELKKLELADFYKNIIRTLDVWFCEQPSDALARSAKRILVDRTVNYDGVCDAFVFDFKSKIRRSESPVA